MRLTSRVEGKTVVDLDIRRNFGINIIAVKHGENLSIDILPTTVLHDGDTLTVIGRTDALARFEEFLGKA